MIGAPLEGRVLVIDDVITAGTAITEAVNIIRRAGARPAGILIALDRQERGTSELSAVQEIGGTLRVPVASILTLDDLVEHLEISSEFSEFLPLVEKYRLQYGARSQTQGSPA